MHNLWIEVKELLTEILFTYEKEIMIDYNLVTRDSSCNNV